MVEARTHTHTQIYRFCLEYYHQINLYYKIVYIFYYDDAENDENIDVDVDVGVDDDEAIAVDFESSSVQ